MSQNRPSQQRAAAYAKWARTEDRTQATATARAASLTKLDETLCEKYGIDLSTPGGPLRLEAARRGHFAALAAKRHAKAVGK